MERKVVQEDLHRLTVVYPRVFSRKYVQKAVPL
jgi:hypothetical protein